MAPIADCKHQEFTQDYYGVTCKACGLFYADGCAPWDDDAPEYNEEPDEFEAALNDCMKGADGLCGKAGSGECDFECPFSR